ncbi:MFS transporter [Protaetiibacter sp. SSC-01]|nr:MFS transporter [Protaetiibacter sp. SSC-01]
MVTAQPEATREDENVRDRLPRALRPFRFGQYRLLAVALTLSLFGAGVWLIAVVFQIRATGGGPVEVSFVATANAIGLLLAVLVGGAVADRVPQKLILLTVEIVKGVLVTAVAALAFTGGLEVWHLALVGLVLGVADGFFMPAYSAMLPAILPEQQLLAANGFEGMLRPAILQAGGPAVAAGLIALWSPAAAFAIIAVTQLGAIALLVVLRRTAVRREVPSERHPAIELLVDVRDGFRYLVRTPWLFATLVFSCALVLLIMGPFEVLLPFAVTEQTGGDAGSYALVLVAFGVGGAVAAIAVASWRLPRRYLTTMTLAWGFGCLPLLLVAFTSSLWVMVIAAFAVGMVFSGAGVIWGTLLQRRVPPAMLGRVSSLDFFVSLALMPVSTAVAGPLGEAIGYGPVFVVAAVVPPVLAVVAVLAARMPRDELAHPLDA